MIELLVEGYKAQAIVASLQPMAAMFGANGADATGDISSLKLKCFYFIECQAAILLQKAGKGTNRTYTLLFLGCPENGGHVKDWMLYRTDRWASRTLPGHCHLVR